MAHEREPLYDRLFERIPDWALSETAFVVYWLLILSGLAVATFFSTVLQVVVLAGFIAVVVWGFWSVLTFWRHT
ncbi:MAG: hypothetical protein OXE53_13130 [Deltaproteobacteria bacterium]|nr:hypothetical protein [Deltaproteobacteria bacterium]